MTIFEYVKPISMKRTQKIYQKIDNHLYDSSAKNWWGADSDMLLLKNSVNPVRVPYFDKILDEQLTDNRHSYKALEVGCGGGYLTEEIAKMGFQTWGIDPSSNVLEVASEHAKKQLLTIEYIQGRGEELPFEDAFFDIVFCCDVLEHVEDVDMTLQEISRVLKSGGIFLFDTINRTWISWLLMIKVLQDWPILSFMPPRLHVWEMFIKPHELSTTMDKYQLHSEEYCGMSPKRNPLNLFINIIRFKSGLLSFHELSKVIELKKSHDLNVSYMGYAKKLGQHM